MSEHLETAKKDGTLTISIKGGFNAGLVQNFRDIFEDIDTSDQYIVLDLAEAEYIDSAALGLMIHMKKRFERSKIKSIRVTNCNARIRKVFETMQFQQLFEIDMLED